MVSVDIKRRVYLLLLVLMIMFLLDSNCVCCHLMVTSGFVAVLWLPLHMCLVLSHGCGIVCFHLMVKAVCCHLMVTAVFSHHALCYVFTSHGYYCVYVVISLLLCLLPSHGYHCAYCHLMVIVCCHFMVTTVHVAISWLLLCVCVAISWLFVCVCVCCPLIVMYVCVATSWLLLCVLPSHGYCCVCCHFMITAVCCQFMVTIVFVLQKWGGNCPQDHQECGEIPRGSQAGNQCPWEIARKGPHRQIVSITYFSPSQHGIFFLCPCGILFLGQRSIL